MLTRIRLDSGIDTAEHTQVIFDAIKDKKTWFIPISPHEPNTLEIHLCNHDPPRNEPCTLYEQIIDGVVTVHKGVKV